LFRHLIAPSQGPYDSETNQKLGQSDADIGRQFDHRPTSAYAGGTFQIGDAGGALHHLGADAFAREDLEQ